MIFDNLIEKNHLESRYNAARNELLHLTTLYFRQDIASNYITEEAIMRKVSECQRIKEAYIKLRDTILHPV